MTKVEDRPYEVRWGSEASPVAAFYETRHQALQAYVELRKKLRDFGPAETRMVRIFHTGIEYHHEDASGWGASPRQLHGSARPINGEVVLP